MQQLRTHIVPTRKPSREEVVVLGGGLGGLTVAAFLVRAGCRVLLFERGSALGGCCATRTVDGVRFDVGANYFGRHLLNVFRALGRRGPFEAISIKARGVIRQHGITHPFGGHSLPEFFSTGMGAPGMISLLGRLYGQLCFDVYRKEASSEAVMDRVAGDPLLAAFFHMEALLLGSQAERMPSYLFNVIFGSGYGFDRPFYPAGGAEAIVACMAEVVRQHGGEVRTGQGVDALELDGGVIRGVQVDGVRIEARRVISTLGTRATAALLPEGAAPGLAEAAASIPRGLRFGTLLLALEPGPAAEPELHTVVCAGADLASAMRMLFEGRMPPLVPFVLTRPGRATDPASNGLLPAVVRFPLPQGAEDDAELLEGAAREVMDAAEGEAPGLSDHVRWWRLYSPRAFREAFGFEACYSPELETRDVPKPGHQTEIGGLYLAGAAAGARGVHTGAAAESARGCARMILKEART